MPLLSLILIPIAILKSLVAPPRDRKLSREEVISLQKIRIFTAVLILLVVSSKVYAIPKEPTSAALIGVIGDLGSSPSSGAVVGFADGYCHSYGCHGYTLLAGYKPTTPSASFIEVGSGLYVLYFPLYAGAGVRMKDGKPSGGQISLASGFGPFFVGSRAYNEAKRLKAEIWLGLFLPIFNAKGS
jgi:hypothetical protein